MGKQLTNIAKWLDINSYKPPFSKETITKAIVSTVGSSPSSVSGYWRILTRTGVLRAGFKNTYVLKLDVIEKLENTKLTKIKESWNK